MRKSVTEVFTPRNRDVNERMYIHRERLEKEFSRALGDGRNIILLGESGNGKTWLYRKVLVGNYRFYVANCALAGKLGSLVAVINDAVTDGQVSMQVGYKTVKKVGGGIPKIAEGGLQQDNEFIIQRESLLAETLRRAAAGVVSAPIIVFENLEVIFSSPEFMAELASLILLLDDPKYSEFGIKFLIVGTPSGVIEYFSKVPNSDSVSNRLIELPKVTGLSEKQVSEFVKKGYVGELGLSLSDADLITISDHVSNVTLGIAQRVHEYCKYLGYCIEDNDGRYDASLLADADRRWMAEGMRHSYFVVSSRLGRSINVTSRKDQVIFAIGLIRGHMLDAGMIETVVRANFQDAQRVVNLGVAAILRDLSRGDNPLLVLNGGGKYRVADPRYLMCIRLIVVKSRSEGKIIKKVFSIN